MDEPEKTVKPREAPPPATRESRLAAALRANLKRRKAAPKTDE